MEHATLTRALLTKAWIPALGAAGSLALSLVSPLASDDALRGTLTVLPLVLSLLLWIDHAGSWRSKWGEWAGLGLLMVLFLIRRQTIPAAGDVFFVLALVIWLGMWTVRRLSVWRRLLGTRLPRVPPAPFFLVPLVLYLLVLPWSTAQRSPDGDEPWNLLLAHSIAYDFDLDLANNYRDQDSLRFMSRAIEPQPLDPTGPSGQQYSRHGFLLPLLAAPAYRVAGKHGAFFLIALMAAGVAWMTVKVAYHYWPKHPGESLLAWGTLALTAPLLLYSHQMWVEVPAALLTLAALDRLKIMATRTANRTDWALLGTFLGGLVLLKLRFALLVASLLVLAWMELRSHRKRLMIFFVIGGAAGAGLLLVNRQMFGSALKMHSLRELLLDPSRLGEYSLHLSGVFFDSAFGLFATAPIWVLLIPACLILCLDAQARPLGRRLLRDAALIAGPYLLILATRREWYGGWSPPFRYPLVLLPLLCLVLIAAFRDRRALGPRFAVGTLTAATIVLSLLWIALPGWTYNFADGRSHLLDHLSSTLGSDVARSFPSATRPRVASLVWPPATVALVLAVWWGARPRRPARSLTVNLAAVGALLLAASALPAALKLSPTRRIEVESPHVRKSGGHRDPDRWITDRRRFPEAWALREGENLLAPVQAGGADVLLEINARFIRNYDADLALQVYCGDRLMQTLRYAQHDVPQVRATAKHAWTDGEPLRLAIEPPATNTVPGVLNGIVIDRIDLRWR